MLRILPKEQFLSPRINISGTRQTVSSSDPPHLLAPSLLPRGRPPIPATAGRGSRSVEGANDFNQEIKRCLDTFFPNIRREVCIS
ncbi:hypothetical protein CEXT_760131 [Caerostris extrusa]|uniref:Uncharacterized protein n=1 Tax=Caerostris extrusa TaxID=172846 RepID=A0AAV4UYC7_CAEEX|nr:hypothetical protein CEXT_760131 [Caerostris extrusa]